jgi:excisionase family DNA binding protein
MNQLYDVKGAALVLAVSPWTIRAFIRQGKLRPVRIGRLVRIDELELQKFIANAKLNSGSQNDLTQGSEKEESCPTT